MTRSKDHAAHRAFAPQLSLTRAGGTASPGKLHPHPRQGCGLSRNKAGEAGNKSRGTRQPNSGEVNLYASAGAGGLPVAAISIS